jgi:type II restriction/modification system DNA methylase subunit YeeA
MDAYRVGPISVTYWFEKARVAIEQGKSRYAGLVATQSIRAGSNHTVLKQIKESGDIFEAWSDEPWIVEGAALRVSLVCFARKEEAGLLPHQLDGEMVEVIHADLTTGKADALDLTKAKLLKENQGIAFQGTIKVGAFDIPGNLARKWLQAPLNPNSRPNSDVLRPWANGKNFTGRPLDKWIIDFGVNMPEKTAALYELPFQYAVEHIKQTREGKREVQATKRW